MTAKDILNSIKENNLNEASIVSIVRGEFDRIAILEHNTPQGKLYSLQKLYRSKELAMAQAKKILASKKDTK